MQFSVGDKVMYPKIGAGQIMGVDHRELVQGFKHYYVIQIFTTGATAYVPVRKMDELGVRLVMSQAKLAQVLYTLRDVSRVLSKDYRQRQEQIREKLGTGRPIPIAEVVRDLTWRGEHGRLTKKDQDLLAQGRELLATEMAMATDMEIFATQGMIDAALQVARANESDEPARIRQRPRHSLSVQS